MNTDSAPVSARFVDAGCRGRLDAHVILNRIRRRQVARDITAQSFTPRHPVAFVARISREIRPGTDPETQGGNMPTRTGKYVRASEVAAACLPAVQATGADFRAAIDKFKKALAGARAAEELQHAREQGQLSRRV